MEDLGVKVILEQLQRRRQEIEESVKRHDSAQTTELLDRLTHLRQRAEELLRRPTPTRENE